MRSRSHQEKERKKKGKKERKKERRRREGSTEGNAVEGRKAQRSKKFLRIVLVSGTCFWPSWLLECPAAHHGKPLDKIGYV
jgi:hypothetical protein